eukprot:TRINITY_DN3394_c0_g1_i13.p1 TRINITY_DN3394_c0_g1~~TRINITY_DN3394_c0_g1_i13.p1  ORF type:complete len:398 (-),score=21.23 TRINITY_DN3394_c0_g1_i13:3-1196(-)
MFGDKKLCSSILVQIMPFLTIGILQLQVKMIIFLFLVITKGEDSNSTQQEQFSNDSDDNYTYNLIQRVQDIDDSIRKNSSKVEDYPFIGDSTYSYVAICALMRDEHRYIEEWLLYHQYIGVKKFYLYDNLSQPPMLSLVQDFVAQGLVEYTYLTTQWMLDEFGYNENPTYLFGRLKGNSPQRWAHYDCFSRHKNKHKFMALLDIDEFIVLNKGGENGFKPVEQPNLPAFLKKFENNGGLFISWREFGSSGYIQRPQNLVLRSYIKCSQKTTRKAKHIVNMKYFMGTCVVHYCETSVPSVNQEFVNTQFTQAEDRYLFQPSWEGISLHHYIYKSLEDYKQKISRGGGHNGKGQFYQSYRSMKNFNQVDKLSTGNCSYMVDVGNKCCSKAANRNFIDQT